MVCLCLVAGMEEYMEQQRTAQQLSPPKKRWSPSAAIACMSILHDLSVRKKDAIRIHVSSFLDMYAGRKVESNNASCSCSFLISLFVYYLTDICQCKQCVLSKLSLVVYCSFAYKAPSHVANS